MAKAPRKTGQLNSPDPANDPRVQQLLSQWSTLGRFLLGDSIRDLRKDYTLKQLEQVLPCSEKKIRDYEMFGQVPLVERSKFEGKGTKKLLKWNRKRRTTLRRVHKLAKGKSGRRLRDKLTATLVKWCETELKPWVWDPFLDEIITLEATKQKIRNHRPAWWEYNVEGDWDKIIAETRPHHDPEVPSTSIGALAGSFDFWTEWFARWYQRCMPIPGIAQTVLLRTRRILREKNKKDGFGEQWDSRFY